MDGSKRSRHSNAFFTGFGRFRKIVLFDTLVQQLSESELEAVLAHEIGHFKKKHIPKMLVFSALSSLVGFYLIALLAKQEWFYRAFGFEPGNVAPALLLVVATIRISSRRLCRRSDERSAIVDRRAAKVERKKSEQSHATSVLQRLLLFAPDLARTRTGVSAVMPESKHTVWRRRLFCLLAVAEAAKNRTLKDSLLK
jgi:Zn-dependent protease with chaperone function